MKKVIIAIIILLILLYLGLRSEKVQDFIDNLRETHEVEIIR
jgi:uncharacterized protein YoxC